MATSNISVTPAWTKIADASNTDLLVTWDTPVAIEFATTAADAAPTIRGHRIPPDSAITRSILGSGYVWAKTVSGAVPADISVVVSK